MTNKEIEQEVTAMTTGEVITEAPAEVAGFTTEQSIDRGRFKAGRDLAEEELRENPALDRVL